jgi:hypothetical protein
LTNFQNILYQDLFKFVFLSLFSGYYQPAGPVIGSASPGSTAPPPTATVQPTVVSSTSSTLSLNRGSTIEQSHRRDEFSQVHHVKERDSPMKTSSSHIFHHHQQQQHQQQQPQIQPPGFIPHPALPGGFSYATPYAAYPYPTSADIYRAAVPPPAHVVHAGMAGTPFYAGQFSAVPPPPPPIPYSYPQDYRPPYSSMYQPTAAQTTFPPQGSYFLAAPTASDVPTYQSPASTAPPSSSIASGGSQLALPTPPHIPAAYYYSGYTIPYSAGRIIAPVLALGVFPRFYFYTRDFFYFTFVVFSLDVSVMFMSYHIYVKLMAV